jgi:anti-sigma regulatory factor (Ser/Thr protein kinase)
MNKILLPKYVDEESIEVIINQYYKPASSIHFDFTCTEFISPFASTLLMGFFGNISKRISFYPYKPKPRGNPHGKNEAILEITRIEKQDSAEIISKVEKAIEINTNYPKGQKYDICVMVAEMIQNIFYHSNAPKSGLITIQNFERWNYTQMIIGDAGIGIPASLRNCQDFKGSSLCDHELILGAVKNGVSRLGKNEDRGEGLARCVELSNKHSAKLYIRSNNGFAAINFNKKFVGEGTFLAGTQISVNFLNK